MDKLLSICIPTYNGEKTIGEMLKVLLPQIDDNIEVIISDNCSTDSTEKIVKEYQNRFPTIVYVKNNLNVGADRNFYNCMMMATGEYCMLLSDDDVLVEDGLSKIKKFLLNNHDVTLAFLYTVSFKDKYMGIDHCENFTEYAKKPLCDVVTTDKKEFISYVGRSWGFVSSFVFKTKRCREIVDIEQYFNTYLFQSYVHVFCSNRFEDKLGIISGPCIAAGGYGIIPNYDAYSILVVAYKKMLDFAVDNANYDKKQFEQLWLWMVCFLLKRQIIKERSINRCITSCKKTFVALAKYPYAWVHLFPYMMLPNWVCKIILNIVRLKEGRSTGTFINRET